MSGTSVLCRLLAPVAYKVMGIDIFARKKWLETAALWSPDERKSWRLARLGDLLEHCWSKVPFYREYWSSHGVKMRRLKSLDELQEYPRITRELLKEYRLQCVATNLSQIPHKTDSTGGTTGSPLQYYHDLDLHALRYGYQLLGWGLAGSQFADEVFVVAGDSPLPGMPYT